MKNHKYSKLIGAVLVLIAAMAVGCAHKERASSPSELVAKIHAGMSRAEVDALLGAPSVPASGPEDEVWYLPPPRIGRQESPFAPGTIGIRFDAEGKVTGKRLNPQYREK